MSEGKPQSKPFDAGRSPLHPSFLCLSQESSAPKSLGAGDFLAWVRVIHGADAPWLDSCDKHRTESVWGIHRTTSKAWHP